MYHVAELKAAILTTEGELEEALWETTDTTAAGRIHDALLMVDGVLEGLAELSTEGIASAMRALAYMRSTLG